jgi:hypothetical protein
VDSVVTADFPAAGSGGLSLLGWMPLELYGGRGAV